MKGKRGLLLAACVLLLAVTAVIFSGCGGGNGSTQKTEGDIKIEDKTLLDTPEVVNTAKQQASSAARQANLAMLNSAIQAYYMSEGTYPTSLQQLVPTYMRSVPTDPAGGVYYVTADGQAAVR